MNDLKDTDIENLMTPLCLKDKDAFDYVKRILPETLNLNDFEIMNYYPAHPPETQKATISLFHHSGMSVTIHIKPEPRVTDNLYAYPTHPKKLLL